MFYLRSFLILVEINLSYLLQLFGFLFINVHFAKEITEPFLTLIGFLMFVVYCLRIKQLISTLFTAGVKNA